MNPLISVILPVYNQAPFVQEAIESILNQTFKDFEVIVINDCSKDESLNAINSIRDPRIKVFSNKENLGISYCLNFGISVAQASIIARMDGDDICHSDRFFLQYEYLSKNPKVAAVGCWMKLFKNDENFISVHKYPSDIEEVKTNLIFENSIPHPGVMFRKSIIDSLGGYTNKYQYAEDWELWMKLSRDYDLTNIPYVLLYYRVHNHSVSKIHTTYQSQSKLRLIKDNLQFLGFNNLEGLCFLEENFNYKNLSLLHKTFLNLKEQNNLLRQYKNIYFAKTLQRRLESYILRSNEKLLRCILFFLRFKIFSTNSYLKDLLFIKKLTFLYIKRKLV